MLLGPFMAQSRAVFRRGSKFKLLSRTKYGWVLFDWTHEEWCDKTAEPDTAGSEERNRIWGDGLVDSRELVKHAWYAFLLHKFISAFTALYLG
jgi:hypothetical protein